MEKTDNLNLNLPGTDDYYNIEDFNENFRAIDEADGSMQSKVEELSAETQEALATVAETDTYARDSISEVQYDLQEIAFQLAVKDLIDDSTLRNIIVDKIDSADAVNLTSGTYADGKVYI